MIAIDVDRVDRVRIGGVWWTVYNDSFEVDRYQFVYHGEALGLDLGPAFQFTARRPNAARSGMLETFVVSGPVSTIEMIEHRPPTGPIARRDVPPQPGEVTVPMLEGWNP